MEGRPHLDHGQLGYLQIPTTDVAASRAFYSAVFGWQVDDGALGFTAPGVIGQFFDEHAPTPDAGVLLWINVDDLDAALAAAVEAGGARRSEPAADGPHRTLATVTDPAGNTLGLFELHR